MDDEVWSGTSRIASETAPADQNSQQGISVKGAGPGPGPGPAQYQGQREGQGQGQCICNPCCGSNLRQACFAIAIIELVFFILTSVAFIVQVAEPKIFGMQRQSQSYETGEYTDDPPFELLDGKIAYIARGFGMLLWISAIVSLFIGVIARKNIGCLLHSVFVGLFALYQFIQVILGACSILESNNRIETCRNYLDQDNDNYSIKYRNCGVHQMKTQIRFGFKIGDSIITMLLATYFAVVSAGLYTQYRAGNKYEGTSLCSSCCGGGNQNQPQYQYQYQNQNQPTAPPPPAYRKQ